MDDGDDASNKDHRTLTKAIAMTRFYEPDLSVDLDSPFGPVRDVVGILRGVISGNMIISY
jgi:hypothetical protein